MKTITFRPINRWLEPLFVVVIISALVRAYFYFLDAAYLPQPFFYDPSDVWMDWFNPAFWAYEPGAYGTWGTIYPPLSFVFLRIFSVGSCYSHIFYQNARFVRDCDWIGLMTFHSFYVLNIFLLWRTFRKVDRTTALWRTIGIGFGLPAVCGLERGNLVIVCFTFFILGFGPLLKSARARWLAVGFALNFKVYLVAALFPQLLRRRWAWFEGALISVVAVYLVTFCIMGDGTPIQIYNNITNIAGDFQPVDFTDIWNAATYNPFIALLSVQSGFIAGLLGSRFVDVLLVFLPALQVGTRIFIVFAALAAWLRPEAVPMHRLTLLGMAFAMVSSETGGYTESLLIFLVFLERWRGFARCWAIVASYILLLPFDIILDRLPTVPLDSFLAGHATYVTYYITVGPFVRPLIVLSVIVALSCATIADVLADIKHQGWRRRWRYNRDVAILPGVIAPVRPTA
jgi:hypothetical protein